MQTHARPILVLVRHGESEWNEKNLFTGCHDVALTEKGKEESRHAGMLLKEAGFVFDTAYASALTRSQETLAIILAELGQATLPVVYDKALNERDYGELVGLNKKDVCSVWGEDQIACWRRSYDARPPGGESLEDTAKRVVPFFHEHIETDIQGGKSVLVVAHGNSLRALVMALEHISPQDIPSLTLETGVPRLYTYDAGSIIRVS